MKYHANNILQFVSLVLQSLNIYYTIPYKPHSSLGKLACIS